MSSSPLIEPKHESNQTATENSKAKHNAQQQPLFSKLIEVRWADCDGNQHLRHSAYADFACHTRVAFINHIGLDTNWLHSRN